MKSDVFFCVLTKLCAGQSPRLTSSHQVLNVKFVRASSIPHLDLSWTQSFCQGCFAGQISDISTAPETIQSKKPCLHIDDKSLQNSYVAVLSLVYHFGD